MRTARLQAPGLPQFEYDTRQEEVNTVESTPPEPNSPNLEPENHPDRGMLVVDETLLGLIPFLEEQRFWVRPLSPGMDNEILSRATAVRSGIGFRAKVQEARDDPRPPFSEEEAEAHMAKLRSEALSKMK
jgi:hypothetical protein